MIAEAVGEAAVHDLKVFFEVEDDTQAQAPRNGDA